MALDISSTENFLGRFLRWLIGGRGRRADVDLRVRLTKLAVWAHERSKLGGEPLGVKSKNFMPRLHEGRLELSTFCVEDMPEADAWALLDTHAPKPVLGRGEFLRLDARQLGLLVEPNWEPPRHVNLVQWPDEYERQKDIAQALHARQRYIPR